LFALTGPYIEMIHDELVAQLWSDQEPTGPADYRDTNLIESAVGRPFQTFFEQDLYVSPYEKAAALFHSLVCNHCFQNGNKRTALIALDHFLTANGYCLVANNARVYQLAKQTAKHNQDGIRAERALESIVVFLFENAYTIEFLERSLLDPAPDATEDDNEALRLLIQSSIDSQWDILTHPLNERTVRKALIE
jgi:death-on-curing family protein